jgi:hypothetical protein
MHACVILWSTQVMKLEEYVHDTLLTPEGGDRRTHIQDRVTGGVRASLLYNESRPEFYKVGAITRDERQPPW